MSTMSGTMESDRSWSDIPEKVHDRGSHTLATSTSDSITSPVVEDQVLDTDRLEAARLSANNTPSDRNTLRVLVSAFDPYEDLHINPAKEVATVIGEHGLEAGVRASDATALNLLEQYELDIHTILLPISFAASWPILEEAITTLQPNMVLAMGVKHHARGVLLERCASNVMDACRPDVDEKQPHHKSIVEGAPASYWTRLPLRAILKTFADHNIPASLSSDAGTYVCNALFYQLLRWAYTHSQVMAGFLSFPALQREQSSRGSRLDMQHLVAAGCDVIYESLQYFVQHHAQDTLILDGE